MSREILKITGEDREHFLQGLVSNDVTRLKHGLVYTAMVCHLSSFQVGLDSVLSHFPFMSRLLNGPWK